MFVLMQRIMLHKPGANLELAFLTELLEHSKKVTSRSSVNRKGASQCLRGCNDTHAYQSTQVVSGVQAHETVQARAVAVNRRAITYGKSIFQR